MSRPKFPLGRVETSENEETPIQKTDNAGPLNAALRAGVEAVSYNRPDVSSLFSAARTQLQEVK